MEDTLVATVFVFTEAGVLQIPYSAGFTAEDLCIQVCIRLEITPLYRPLFGLRNHSSEVWYPLCYELQTNDEEKFDFRFRFRPASFEQMKKEDPKAYGYYFDQVRCDVFDDQVPEIHSELKKSALIGLGICDMYRVMLEQNVPRKTIESDYKKYIPKSCVKRHGFFLKTPIHRELKKITGHDGPHVRELYLNQFKTLAPNYPFEEYRAMMEQRVNGMIKPQTEILLRVHPTEVVYTGTGLMLWKPFCAIDNLCAVTVHKTAMELIRKNESATYLHFSTRELLISFVSALDGYYRLSVDWGANICSAVKAPSRKKLAQLRCHGPVGLLFSYEKLVAQCGRVGAFILRESDRHHNVICIDVIARSLQRYTFEIHQRAPKEFFLKGSPDTVYPSVIQVLLAHRDSKRTLYLTQCLPPKSCEMSPVLLGAVKPEFIPDVFADEETIASLLDGRFGYTDRKNLYVSVSKPYPQNLANGEFRVSRTLMQRALWRLPQAKKHIVVIRTLKKEHSSLGSIYSEKAYNWSCLRSNSLVRYFGLAYLSYNPVNAILMELMKLGPLDLYLEKWAQIVQTADLVQAALGLAGAMGYLRAHNFIHGRIRCRKLMVHTHTKYSFEVKLSDPGFSDYTEAELHWLPPECHLNLESARENATADLWSVGTTLWQIFSKSAPLPFLPKPKTVRRFYATEHRLPCPPGCHADAYKIMSRCWDVTTGPQIEPDDISNAMREILFEVYDSRRVHDYATVGPRLLNTNVLSNTNVRLNAEVDDAQGVENNLSECESRASSLSTDRTSLACDDNEEGERLIRLTGNIHCVEDAEIARYFEGLNLGEPSNNDESMLFELDIDANVILQGKIGQGFYGDVFKGTLCKLYEDDGKGEDVAVKKLKKRVGEAHMKDFEREIEIMKRLRHRNIVQILTVVAQPDVCLIMEFLKYGSLRGWVLRRLDLPRKTLLGYALDIATGMDYLESQRIVHRDLAARNVLVADENHVKIGDFGLAQVTGENNYYVMQTMRDLPVKWYAPECLRDGKFSTKSDVWSFGVTMHETFGRGQDPELPEVGDGAENPTNLLSAIVDALERGTRFPCPPDCPQDIYTTLMLRCWQWDSRERPHFATLCRDIRDLIEQY